MMDVAARFDRVVIASGDGMFAIAARYLRRHGLSVTVVGRPGSVSRIPAAAVTNVRWIEIARTAA